MGNTQNKDRGAIRLGSQKFNIGKITVLLLATLCLCDIAQANKLGTRSKNQLHLEAYERAEGIFDRAVQKLEQKEEAKKKMVQEQVNEQLMMQQ